MYKLPKLPYAFDSLEPYISSDTMKTHYGKHHQGYIDKTNELAGSMAILDLSKLVRKSYNHNQDLFNNASQAWNHTFFWYCLTPNQTEPSDFLVSKLDMTFGSFENFKNEFIATGASIFGSGWVWLIETNGTLGILAAQDAGTPLVHNSKPLLVLDVWEHAYYLDYKNKREIYLTVIFDNIINWEIPERMLMKQGI